MSYGQGISTVASVAKAGIAAHKMKKLELEAKELEKNRPKIQRDPMSDENLQLVKSELAGGGMSAQAEQAYTDLNNNQFSSSLGAILRGGGDVNSVGALYGSGEEGRLKLAMMKDNNRLNQIKNVLDQSEKVDERNYITPWQVNVDAVWKDKAQALAEARRANAKEYESAWNGIVGGASGMGADSQIGGGGGGGASGGSGGTPDFGSQEQWLGG